jgi:tetrahydromethanopterin S-methyltransferase subunit F
MLEWKDMEDKMTTIYELTADIVELEERLTFTEEFSATSAEAADHTEAYLAAFFDAEEGLADKIDAYVHVVRDKEAIIKARKKEIGHLKQMNKAEANAVDRLKEAVKYASQQLGRPKLKGNAHTITVSENSRPAIDITDENAIPEEFKEQVISWKIDKKAIADHLVATGEIVDGTEPRKVVTVRFR